MTTRDGVYLVYECHGGWYYRPSSGPDIYAPGHFSRRYATAFAALAAAEFARAGLTAPAR